MRITRKSDYGLRAMCELAKSHGRSPISITEVAAAQGIPDPFLEKIMQELKSAGLIAATHGRGGGYSLERAPNQISVREVIEALEGPMALVTCLDPALKCMIEDGCPTSSFWALINERFEQALGATTLADLLQRIPGSHSPKHTIPEESGLVQ
ncbi:MAG: hypothetical protein A2Z21_06645 [Candidatus Fraserbacteria bacterium RBG_16_55_9]|uniref:Rrf2 family transcriptional regulator n=1 Tax=Fraserbacteria sp. (strain RBG_16_55_9) TaxID=1817864 RepID=A0A1F5UWF0_FRAXR|nr:MAG: hypothetical protein A2Z21_06645 [Candidatus Fraserbacteria bacterium RBG_16_55_9]